MKSLRFGHIRAPFASLTPSVKSLDIDLFGDVKTDVSYGGYVKDGALLPDLNCRYRQWFNGYTPEIYGAFYSASLKIYYVVQAGYVMEKGENEDYFVSLCQPIELPCFFYDEYDGEQYRVIMRNASAGKILTPYVSNDFTPEVNLCMAVRHHHRLFGLDADDGLLVRWSGASSSLDWTEGINASGYVRLGGGLGEVVEMVSYGSSVVILRKSGLTCLTALGAPENFKITDLAAPSSIISAGCAAVCGGCLYFFTETGIMRFDGDGITAVKTGLDWGISPPQCAAARGEKYLLGCGDRVYCYDAADGVGYFINCPATTFLNGEKLLAFGSGEAHIIDGEEQSVTWKSRRFNFGRSGRKTVTGLFFNCEGTAQVVISNGRSSRTVTGAGGFYKVGLCGENFTAQITADGKVSGAALYAEVCDGI